MIHRQAIGLAERAADDCVLEAGVAPSRYADDLLHVARNLQKPGPALSVPMVLRTDVGR